MAKKQVEETKGACLEFYNKTTKKAIEHIFEADELRLGRMPIWAKNQRGVLEKSFLKLTVVKGEKETEFVIGAPNSHPWIMPADEIRDKGPEIKRY